MMNDYNPSFAKYYHILTEHKDYEGEVERLHNFLRKEGIPSGANILSVGCGLGAHERLLAKQYNSVHGIDISEPMIAFANAQTNPHNTTFTMANVAELQENNFACAISLFNVVNCIEARPDLFGFFESIASRLVDGGLILFEVWNATEVLREPPVVVKREYLVDNIALSRTVTPEVLTESHIKLVYDVIGEDHGQHVEFRSVHEIHLHTTEELEAVLEQCGFVDFTWYSSIDNGLRPKVIKDRMLACRATKHSGAHAQRS